MSDAGFTFVGEDYLVAPQAMIVLPFGMQKLVLRYVTRARKSIVLMWYTQPDCLLPLHIADTLAIHSPKHGHIISAFDVVCGGITHLIGGESLLFKTLNMQNKATRTVLVSHIGSARPPYITVERYVCH